MHSTLNRAQAVFGFFTTVALVVAGLAALSVLFYPTDGVTSQVKVRDVKVTKGRPHYYSTRKEEYAQMRFDLDADLTPLFNWNTKQLFVYVYASYPSDSPSSSSTSTNSSSNSASIIWDTIIPAPESAYSFDALRERFFPSKPQSKSSGRKSSAKKTPPKVKAKATAKSAPGILRLRDQKPKYQIGDVSGRMAERSNVTLSVGWNVQPWVGALWWAPGSGSLPRTHGGVGSTGSFALPALKGKQQQAQAQQGRKGASAV
ncbi:signal peptidase complex subunit SPC3 [Aspergillus homomorphus CBS 101889]|uniref:Signal peptidase subunit 3 n=1 Tax=Aspergillus homomorphus (strain CBS 101889) TaxID=1450537 RepID=A0A395HMM1_ASPHC|nr:microsomal signal peptidase subunit [Aspergillus homomorphus CBS 101889]RAL09182.1 microsomal signal peptidase subunit [Aspergillus homomorphus CBS 101889]